MHLCSSFIKYMHKTVHALTDTAAAADCKLLHQIVYRLDAQPTVSKHQRLAQNCRCINWDETNTDKYHATLPQFMSSFSREALLSVNCCRTRCGIKSPLIVFMLQHNTQQQLEQQHKIAMLRNNNNDDDDVDVRRQTLTLIWQFKAPAQWLRWSPLARKPSMPCYRLITFSSRSQWKCVWTRIFGRLGPANFCSERRWQRAFVFIPVHFGCHSVI